MEEEKSLAELMEIEMLKNTDRPSRKEYPHVAVLTFRIEVRSLSRNNTMGESVLGNNELMKWGMSNKAKIHVKGATEAECIQKVKNMLENLDVESRK